MHFENILGMKSTCNVPAKLRHLCNFYVSNTIIYKMNRTVPSRCPARRWAYLPRYSASQMLPWWKID